MQPHHQQESLEGYKVPQRKVKGMEGRNITKTTTATITMSVVRSGHITIETGTEEEVQEIANTPQIQPPLAGLKPPDAVVTVAAQMPGDGLAEEQFWGQYRRP